MTEIDQRRSVEEDEDDGDIDEAQYKHAKDAILFAIDVSQSMLICPPGPEKDDGDSALSASLKCAYDLMMQRIISNPSDMIGILLFGTERSNLQGEEVSGYTFIESHFYLLVDLGVPSAEDVKVLKNLIEDREEFSRLMVPCKKPASIADVLWCANTIFTARAANFSSKRLFIVTDNDSPHLRDRTMRSMATIRASDLWSLQITIELFPVVTSGKSFDRTRFYNDIIYSAGPTDLDAPGEMVRATATSPAGEGITHLESLLSAINSRAVAKRALFASIPLQIGPDLKISVKGYIMFKRQEPKRTTYVWLKDEKAQISKLVPNKVADDSEETRSKKTVQKAYKLGAEQILFSASEMADLRNLGEPIIRIVGFKGITPDTLPIWANLKNSTFLYPSEEEVVGSTRVFSALQRKLIKDKKMAIAWFISRRNAAPQIVAIIASDEKLDEEGEQVLPQGLWLLTLPYADDIRIDPEAPISPAADTLIDKMRPIIQELQLRKARYYPGRYPSPALQWHYRILQALALDETIPESEEAEDKTRPYYKRILERAGTHIEEWANELQEQYRTQGKDKREMAIFRKRPTQSSLNDDQQGSKKRLKVASESNSVKDDEMRSYYMNHCINKLSIADIRAWLATKNLATSGRKSALVDQVESWFEQK